MQDGARVHKLVKAVRHFCEWIFVQMGSLVAVFHVDKEAQKNRQTLGLFVASVPILESWTEVKNATTTHKALVLSSENLALE